MWGRQGAHMHGGSVQFTWWSLLKDVLLDDYASTSHLISGETDPEVICCGALC